MTVSKLVHIYVLPLDCRPASRFWSGWPDEPYPLAGKGWCARNTRRPPWRDPALRSDDD